MVYITFLQLQKQRKEVEDGIEEYEGQDAKVETIEVEKIEIKNGIPTLVKVQEERKIPIFDDVEVIDELGNKILNPDGQTRTYQMPRMVKKTRPKYRKEVIGDCLGLNADQIYAAAFGALQKNMILTEDLINRVRLLEMKARR